MSPDLAVARQAALAGAAIVATRFGRRVEGDLKGEVDPVTETDREAETAVLSLLRDRRPDDRILSEESGGAAWRSGRVWIVDPLDGTINFMHGVPQVAVSVAVWEDGEPLAGVVVDPISDETFSAARGEGAWRNGAPISVSGAVDPVRSLIATGFPYDRQQHPNAYAAGVAAVLGRFQGIRRIGSAALDICWVADGRFDGYWEYGLAPWDAAAAVLIAAEAGAAVSRPDGGIYRLDDPGLVVATPRIHASLCETVMSAYPEHLR